MNDLLLFSQLILCGPQANPLYSSSPIRGNLLCNSCSHFSRQIALRTHPSAQFNHALMVLFVGSEHPGIVLETWSPDVKRTQEEPSITQPANIILTDTRCSSGCIDIMLGKNRIDRKKTHTISSSNVIYLHRRKLKKKSGNYLNLYCINVNK